MWLSKRGMEPAVRKALPRAIGGPGIDLFVSINDGLVALRFSDTIPQIGYEFLECPDLCRGWLVAIEIADQADA